MNAFMRTITGKSLQALYRRAGAREPAKFYGPWDTLTETVRGQWQGFAEDLRAIRQKTRCAVRPSRRQ